MNQSPSGLHSQEEPADEQSTADSSSLGLGVQQVNAGFNHLFGIPISGTTQVLLIVVITAIATISVVRGLDGGIRRLSELNIGLAMLLMLFVFILGPTLFLLNGVIENV